MMNPLPDCSDREHSALVDSTLALLRAAEPRMGLEQRVLARLASAPPPSWHRRFAAGPWMTRWMLTAATGVIVAGTVTYGVVHYRGAVPAPVPAAVSRPARPLRQEPVAAAASVGVPEHPLHAAAMPARHRGIRRTFRAQHARTVLPPGTVAPSHPHLLSAPQ